MTSLSLRKTALILSSSCLFFLAASSAAHAIKSPFSHQIAFCTEGLNSKKACVNNAHNITTWGPVTVRVAVAGGKFYAQQACVPNDKSTPIFLKTYCINKSYWAMPQKVKGAVYPNTFDYKLRIPSSLDKKGKVFKVSGNYFPSNGRGCVYMNVRKAYCKTSFLVRVIS